MPIHEYECEKCGNKQEIHKTVKEIIEENRFYDRDNSIDLFCFKCQEITKHKRLMSTFNFKM